MCDEKNRQDSQEEKENGGGSEKEGGAGQGGWRLVDETVEGGGR